jgi:hypothetical protein
MLRATNFSMPTGHKRLKSTSTLGTFVLLLGVGVHGYSQEQPTVDIGSQVKQYVFPALQDKDIVSLEWPKDIVWKADEYEGVALPSEKPVQTDGVYWVDNTRAGIHQTSPLRAGFYSDPHSRVFGPQLKVLSQAESLEVAQRFLSKTFSWFFTESSKPTLTQSPISFNGNYKFEWQNYGENELPTTRVTANIRAIDGKIFGFGASEFKVAWPHKITPSQAKKLVLDAVLLKKEVKNPTVKAWAPGGGGGRRYYIVRLEAYKTKTNVKVGSVAEVDASDASIVWSSHGWEDSRDSNFNPEKRLPDDRLPVWTKQGLVFVSNRGLASQPSWAAPADQLFISKGPQQIYAVTSDLKVVPRELYGLPNSSWIATEREGWTYGLDLNNGSYRELANPQRTLISPAINAAGEWAIGGGSGRAAANGVDLFVDDLKRAPQLSLRGRVSLTGEQYQSIFSPDGKWVYFVTSRNEKEKVRHSLHRLAFSVIAKTEPIRNAQAKVQIVQSILPSEVLRLSIFPDGKKLLLQTTEGIQIVSTVDGKSILAKTNALKDKELKNTNIQRIQDGWAGPGNDHITFSGNVRTADRKSYRRIYSCKFDGTDLKALTPITMPLNKDYSFPTGKETVFTIAKQWALGEIAYEDKQKRLNR